MKIIIFLVARLVEFLQCLLVKIMRVIYLSDGEHERLSALVRVVELCAVDEGGDVVEVDAVLPAHDLVPRAVAVAHRLDGQVLVQLLQRDVEDQHGVRRNDAAARSWKKRMSFYDKMVLNHIISSHCGGFSPDNGHADDKDAALSQILKIRCFVLDEYGALFNSPTLSGPSE